MTRETPDLRAATVTAYLCADDRDGLVCALYSGHPTDRGPGHVWVAVEELIAAGTVAWRAASTSGTTPSENVLHVLTATPEPATARETPDLRARLLALLGPSHPHDEGVDCGTCEAYRLLAATPEPAPCRCEHPFSGHRTPGTECSVIGCDCEPYEPAPAVLDVERLAWALHVAEYGEPPREGNANTYKARAIAAEYTRPTATPSEATGGPIPIADITGIDAIERSLLAELRAKVEALPDIYDHSFGTWPDPELEDEISRRAVLALLSSEATE